MATPAPLTALHGDSWESPQYLVAINGLRIDPPIEQWTIRAQAREHPHATAPTFEWTVGGGGIVFCTGEATLANGREVVLDGVQLVLRPADWAGKPTEWSGQLDIELNSDDSPTPGERRTIVRGHPFRVVADSAR